MKVHLSFPRAWFFAIRCDPLRSVETHRQGQVCEAGGLSALQPWAGHPQPASMRPQRFLLLPPPSLSEALVPHPEGQLPATLPVVPGDEDEDMRASPKRPVTEMESPPLVPADPPTQLSQSSSSKRLKKADWPADWTSEYEALKSEPDAALRRSRFSGWCDDLKRHTVHAMSTGPRRDELARWRKEDAAIDRESCSHNWKEGARMGEAKNPGPQHQRARASRPTPTSPTRNRDPGRSNNAITTSANHRGGRAASTASAGEFAMGIRPGPTPSGDRERIVRRGSDGGDRTHDAMYPNMSRDETVRRNQRVGGREPQQTPDANSGTHRRGRRGPQAQPQRSGGERALSPRRGDRREPSRSRQMEQSPPPRSADIEWRLVRSAGWKRMERRVEALKRELEEITQAMARRWADVKRQVPQPPSPRATLHDDNVWVARRAGGRRTTLSPRDRSIGDPRPSHRPRIPSRRSFVRESNQSYNASIYIDIGI